MQTRQRQKARSWTPQKRLIRNHETSKVCSPTSRIRSLLADFTRRSQGAEPRPACPVPFDEHDEHDERGPDPYWQLNMRPPHPWTLIYDYDSLQHFYWHPITQETSLKPPPGSQPVTGHSVQGSHAGAVASTRDGAPERRTPPQKSWTEAFENRNWDFAHKGNRAGIRSTAWA